MKTEITYTPAALIYLADKASFGAALYTVAIGLHHNSQAKIQADRTALHAARLNLEQGRDLVAERRAIIRDLVNQGREYLTLGRDILKPHLGSQHSDAWTVTGFADSLRVPDNVINMTTVLEMFADYLGDHPDREDANLNITAARGLELFNDLTAADNAFNTQKSAVEALTLTRDNAAAALRRRLVGLKDELSQLLGPLDPRWLEFGFNMPGAYESPEAPENLASQLITASSFALTWDAAPRADYYRVWKRVQGVDDDFVAIGSPVDADFTIQDLPANATIEIAVSAVNNGGESSRSTAITIVTH